MEHRTLRLLRESFAGALVDHLRADTQSGGTELCVTHPVTIPLHESDTLADLLACAERRRAAGTTSNWPPCSSSQRSSIRALIMAPGPPASCATPSGEALRREIGRRTSQLAVGVAVGGGLAPARRQAGAVDADVQGGGGPPCRGEDSAERSAPPRSTCLGEMRKLARSSRKAKARVQLTQAAVVPTMREVADGSEEWHSFKDRDAFGLRAAGWRQDGVQFSLRSGRRACARVRCRQALEGTLAGTRPRHA